MNILRMILLVAAIAPLAAILPTNALAAPDSNPDQSFIQDEQAFSRHCWQYYNGRWHNRCYRRQSQSQGYHRYYYPQQQYSQQYVQPTYTQPTQQYYDQPYNPQYYGYNCPGNVLNQGNWYQIAQNGWKYNNPYQLVNIDVPGGGRVDYSGGQAFAGQRVYNVTEATLWCLQ